MRREQKIPVLSGPKAGDAARKQCDERGRELAEAEKHGLETVFGKEAQNAALDLARAGRSKRQRGVGHRAAPRLLHPEFLETARFEIGEPGEPVVEQVQIRIVGKQDDRSDAVGDFALLDRCNGLGDDRCARWRLHYRGRSGRIPTISFRRPPS